MGLLSARAAVNIQVEFCANLDVFFGDFSRALNWRIESGYSVGKARLEGRESLKRSIAWLERSEMGNYPHRFAVPALETFVVYCQNHVQTSASKTSYLLRFTKTTDFSSVAGRPFSTDFLY